MEQTKRKYIKVRTLQQDLFERKDLPEIDPTNLEHYVPKEWEGMAIIPVDAITDVHTTKLGVVIYYGMERLYTPETVDEIYTKITTA